MNVGTWVLLGLVAIAIVAGLVGIILVVSADGVKWNQFPRPPQGYEAARWAGPANPDLLVECLLTTMRLLSHHVPGWSYDAVSRALRDLHIDVGSVNSWREWTPSGFGGEIVEGQTNGNVIMIGPNLSSFLHECAHVCEAAINHREDLGHVGWQDKGIFDAVSAYQGWLAERLSGAIEPVVW